MSYNAISTLAVLLVVVILAILTLAIRSCDTKDKGETKSDEKESAHDETETNEKGITHDKEETSPESDLEGVPLLVGKIIVFTVWSLFWIGVAALVDFINEPDGNYILASTLIVIAHWCAYVIYATVAYDKETENSNNKKANKSKEQPYENKVSSDSCRRI